MKRSLSLSVILITMLLTACTGTTEVTPTSTSMANEIYTIVAQIMESEATPVPPTPTPAPTATAMPSPTKEIKSPPSAIVPQAASYSSSVCDNAVYLADITIPNNTSIAAGEVFTKTWSLQNTGTCAWTETYTVNYISGSSMSGVSTAIGQSVVSGGTVEVSVELTAPTTTGTYTGYWQMANASGTSFGASFFVLIVVPDTVTSTPTATSEYTATATTAATATPTPESTNTPTVSATATSTVEVSAETSETETD